MKLLNYIEENNQNQEEIEGENNINYNELLTKNSKTNENLTSEDLAIHGILTKDNYVNDPGTENVQDEEKSKSLHISKTSEENNKDQYGQSIKVQVHKDKQKNDASNSNSKRSNDSRNKEGKIAYGKPDSKRDQKGTNSSIKKPEIRPATGKRDGKR